MRNFIQGINCFKKNRNLRKRCFWICENYIKRGELYKKYIKVNKNGVTDFQVNYSYDYLKYCQVVIRPYSFENPFDGLIMCYLVVGDKYGFVDVCDGNMIIDYKSDYYIKTNGLPSGEFRRDNDGACYWMKFENEVFLKKYKKINIEFC